MIHGIKHGSESSSTIKEEKMYRPEGWKNPWKGDPGNYYEAGADAMLEELKKKGHFVSKKGGTIDLYSQIYDAGYVVFIPDEE